SLLFLLSRARPPTSTLFPYTTLFRSYLDAKVSPAPQFNEANSTVAYNVKITEGAQYRMGELVITGLSVDAERRLRNAWRLAPGRSEEHTSELQSRENLVCRLLLEKKK